MTRVEPSHSGEARALHPALPCPAVAFDADFPRRLERFAARLSSARERREGAGAASLSGGGHEFIGYRPYGRGEDLRALDWSLLARLDRPYVRVLRRDAGERWLVLLDTSASMGVGPPGKLQRAAEVCAALASLGSRLGAEVRVVDVGPRRDAGRWVRAAKRAEIADVLAFLAARRAEGALAEHAFAREVPSAARASRVFAVGDFLPRAPSDVLALATRGRDVFAVQILAPHELNPDGGGRREAFAEWWEPEADRRVVAALDAQACARYAVELERQLDAWRAACAERRVHCSCSTSALAFEEVTLRALGDAAGGGRQA
jgi:uncharacterized protein (DUF58 family)